MSKVYVLRHANWDLEKNLLDTRSANVAKTVSKILPSFVATISSPATRAIMTANLLNGEGPVIDARAGTFNATKEQGIKIGELMTSNPYGAVGAVFEMPEFADTLKNLGAQLIELIKELLTKYPENENILIVSHDSTMVAAEKIIKGLDFGSSGKAFKEFEGFVVDGNLNILPFKESLI